MLAAIFLPEAGTESIYSLKVFFMYLVLNQNAKKLKSQGPLQDVFKHIGNFKANV